MKLNANELVSKTTQTSARTLLLASSTVIFVLWHSMDPNKWLLLRGDVTSEIFEQAALTIIGFSMVSLVVHWWGDVVAYRRWFKSNVVSAGTFRDGGQPKDTTTPLEVFVSKLKNLEKSHSRLEILARNIDARVESFDFQKEEADEIDKAIQNLASTSDNTAGDIKSLSVAIQSIDILADELDVNFKKVDRAAKFSIYVWYLAIPMMAALLAIVLLLCECV